jgi:hypothetical protein
MIHRYTAYLEIWSIKAGLTSVLLWLHYCVAFVVCADLRAGIYLHYARAAAHSTGCIVAVDELPLHRRDPFGHRCRTQLNTMDG